MVEISGTISKVVYKSPDTGWAVVRIDCDGKKVTAVGKMADAQEGLSLKVKGEWKKDPTYGRQLSVKQATTVLNKSEGGIVAYLSSGFIKGIGPVMAQRIYDKYGQNTYEVIETTPEKLLSISGITQKKVDTISASWKEFKIHRELYEMLHPSGVTQIMCVKIGKSLGFDAVEKIHEDPYILFRKVDGVGFLKADHYAKSINIKKNDPRRLRACIEYTLKSGSKQTGHCYLTYDQMLDQALKLLGNVSKDEVLDMVNKMISDPSSFLRYRKLDGDHAFYFAKIYNTEILLAEKVKELSQRTLLLNYEKSFSKTLELMKKDGLDLSREQQEGLIQVLDSPFSILTGGPGTGKTTITKALVKTFEKMNMSVMACAPTGRAAQRMGAVCGMPASTIHRLLGFKGGSFDFDEKRKLKCDVLLVDECSMIDIMLFYSLLRAVGPNTRVILVGDSEQIQPVGIGDVFRNLVNSPFIQTSKLTKVFRQAADSGIIRFAHALNNDGSLTYTKAEEADQITDCLFHDSKTLNGEDLKEIVRIYSSHHVANEEIQILTPMKNGQYGVENINALIQAEVNPKKAGLMEVKYGDKTYRENDKVIQTTNNYDLNVFNGDLGKIVSIEGKELVVDFDGNLVAYKTNELKELSLAYAITIHKSQGSEFQNVMVLCYKAFFTMLSKNLLYTGATRAKAKLHLIGEYPALKICAQNTTVVPRQTYFPQLLIPEQGDGSQSQVG